MTRQTTSSAALAARESARHADGKFGTQPLDEATGVALDDFDWNDAEQTDDLVEISQRAARRWSRINGSADRGYDVDDVAQDALVALLERRAKGESVDNVHAYVNKAATNASAKAGRSVRSEDFAAYRMLQARKAELSTALGRQVTSDEEAAISAQIREEWHDPRHKPSVDFVLNVKGRERLADTIVNNDEFKAIHHTDQADSYVKPGSWMDRALDGVEGDERNLRESRRMLWNAMAEVDGAPTIEEPHLGHRAVTAARATVKDGTDVAAMVGRWEDEQLTADEEAALFAPWGTPTIREKAAIANTLTRNPSYSYGVWDSALKAATRPR